MAHTHDGKQLHLRGILSLAIKPGSQSTVFTGSDSGQIHAWELSSETTLSVLKGHTKGVCTLSLSPTGTLIASGSYDNTVLLWDTSTFQPLNTTLDNLKHNGRLFSVVFSADGKYLATASEGMKESVRVIEIQSQRVVQKMDTRQRSPMGVHFLEGDQKLMAIASDGEVFLWDRNGKLLSSKKLFTSPSFHITTTTLHQTTLAVGTSTGMVTTFRLPDFQTIRSYTGKVSARITRIQFHPTKQQLIASQLEGSIVLWDLTTGRLQDVVFGHSRGTMDIVYAADGKQLYATGGDLQVSEWTYLRNPGG